MPYDVVLQHGHLIDPTHKIDAHKDIAIQNGKIVDVRNHISGEGARVCFDLRECLITPGLIDAHTHCYHSAGMAKAWAGDYSLQPDYHSFRSGITTMIDTGSAGSYNFGHFKTSVIERSKTRVLAYLNIADYGMSSLMVEQYPERNDEHSFIDCCQQHAAAIVGIKIAHYEGYDWKDVEYAQKVQKSVALPIMVDFGVFKQERPYDVLIEDFLHPGDISTHCFRAPVPVVDENGNVYPYLLRAKERGIKFDLGHGMAGFLFRNAVPAIAQNFIPDSISTDLHGLCVNGAAMDLVTVISKIKACSNLSWAELFNLVTASPANYVGKPDLGHVGVGGEADIAVWSIRNGTFGFQDAAGGRITGTEKLECEMTFRAGELVWNLNARGGTPYETLPPLYGLNTEKEAIVRPRA